LSMRSLNIEEGVGLYRVSARVVPIGEDLVVMIWGGDRPHVGAVSIGIPRPSLENPQITSSTTSVYALIGHKEDGLAKMIADKLASVLERNVVVTAGIHVDNISMEGIKEIENNCSSILKRLISSCMAK
jgi:gallate decarboxylase subunit D